MGDDFELDRDTAVTVAGEGRLTVGVASGWNIGDKPNGGYLVALVARAAATGMPHPDLLVASTHFLRPPEPGPAEVHVEPLRAGRSLATAAARLVQGGRTCLHMVATFGSLDGEGPTAVTIRPPDLPPPDQCDPGDPRLFAGRPMPFLDRLDTRWPPGGDGVVPGSAAGVAEVAAWTRMADGRPPDWLALLVHVDGLPPAVFNVGVSGWVPTLELTVHLRGRPAPGWLRARSRTRALVDGLLEEDAEVFDERGHLVAQSRQLARVLPQRDVSPRPGGPAPGRG